jgi:glycosyltransferase involved in cell wall biosynthesis
VTPIRIVYVIAGLGRGGAEKQLYLLLKHLDRTAFAPTVISLSEGGPWAARLREMGVAVIELPRRRSFEAGRFLRLYRLVREARPDILQTFLFSDNVYGLLAGRLARVPILVASRRIDSYGDSRAGLRRINAALTRWADAVICNAEGSLAYVPAGLRARHVVIRNGIEAVPPSRPRAAVREALGIPLEAPIVGGAGRLVTAKNHRRFIDVAAAVLSERPNAFFLLAGGGPLADDLRAHVRVLGRDGRVRLLGPRDDVPDLFGAADVFLLTSDREGLSNTTMEAMMAGLPCVVTDVGGNRELVQDGETGFVCAGGRVPEMAMRVRELLDDPALRRRLGDRGRARMEAEFSPRVMADATAGLYRMLLRAPGGEAQAAIRPAANAPR